MALSSVELCAGAGGMALGLERAGFKPAALVDNDHHACATLRINRPRWNTIEADIRKINLSPWAGVDLLSGGLPCPPYSLAGKRRGPSDERDLFPAMLDIVERLEPRALLIENVRGLLHSKFDAVRARVDKKLGALGMEAHWALLNAAEFATPQNRSRVFLIALRKGITAPMAWPMPLARKGITVGEALGDLMAAGGWKRADAWVTRANRIAPTVVGGSKKHGGPDLGPTRARKEWADLGVDGLGIADHAPLPDFAGLPRLTARMVARIQGFPDE